MFTEGHRYFNPPFVTGRKRRLPDFIAALACAAVVGLSMTGPAHAQSLAEALDYPLSWTTSGDFHWFGQTNVTRDGLDAAVSGDFGLPSAFPLHSVLEGSASTAGVVSFYCKVSAEFGVGVLYIKVDDDVFMEVGGDQDWESSSIFLWPGQVLRFIYYGTGVLGSRPQRAWVDEVSFAPPLAPLIQFQPVGGDYEVGAPATLSVTAFGAEPLSYQWFLSGSNAVVGGTNAVLSLPALHPAQAGDYTVVLSNAYGVVTSDVATVTMPLLTVALDSDELSWSSFATPWFYQTNVTHDGEDAAQTQGYGQASTTVTGPGEVGFWWKISTTPGWTFCVFQLDGAYIRILDGSSGSDWEFHRAVIPAGQHTLAWRYYNRYDPVPPPSGANKAWLDEVHFSQAPKIVTQPQGQVLQEGFNAEFSVRAIGAPDLHYQWFQNQSLLAGQTNAQLSLTNLPPPQNRDYFVVVSNSYGMVTSAVARLFSFPAVLETTNLTWSSTRDVPWTATTSESHDGVDAAVTGWLPDTSSAFLVSVLDATAETAGVLTFWWKISSLTNVDVMQFVVEGVEQARISGEVDWEQRSFLVPKDALIRWVYNRNILPYAGQNLGWLDEVTFAPVYAPLITTQPRAATRPVAASVELSVAAIGEPSSWQWFFNGTNALPDETNATLAIASVQLSHAGGYSAVVSNAFGVVTSAVAVLDVYWLGDSLDTTNLAWTTSGYANWFNQTNVTHDGVAAAASGLVSDVAIDGYGNEVEAGGQYSLLEARVVGPGTVSFWWKVSSEPGFDVLRFSLGDPGSGQESEQARISGEAGWQQKSFFVPSGEHALWWIYSKDENVTAGQDRGWVDEVTWTPLITPVITNQPSNRVAGFGDTASFAVGAFSAEPLTYQWFFNGTLPLLDETNAELFVSNVNPSVEGGYSVVVSTAFGSVTSVVAQLHLMTLAEALDNDTLVWANTFTTNADPAARWLAKTLSVYDGVDAVQFGPCRDANISRLETQVVGPGLISFWWAANSPAEGISFWIGTNLVEERIETGGLEFREFAIPPGLQTLGWGYSNYQDTVAAEAQGVFLDHVTFQPFGLPPVFTLQPQDAHVRPYIDASGFTADGTGYPPPARQWFFNGQPLSGQTNATLSINPVELTNAGAYQMILSNPNGSVTSAVARLILHKQHLEMAQNLGCVQSGHVEVDVQVVGDRAYVCEFYYGLRVFDISNPANPVLIGSQPTAGHALGVTVSNGLAYVAASTAGVQVFDVTDATNIFQVGASSPKGQATFTALAGPRLYLANGTGGLSVLDVSQPTNILQLGTLRLPGRAERVRVAGHVAYVVCSGSGLYAVDCTDPAHPVVLNFFAQPNVADLQIAGDVLHLALCGTGLLKLDTFRIHESGSLSALGQWVHYAGAGLPPRLQVARGVAYLSVYAPNEEFAGFITLDVYDPARPVWTSEFGTASYANGFQIVGDRIFIANHGAGFCVYQMNEFPADLPRLSCTVLQDGVFRATLTRVPDHFPVVMEGSADLQTWTAVQTNSFFGPALELTFNIGTNSALKFFRVRTH